MKSTLTNQKALRPVLVFSPRAVVKPVCKNAAVLATALLFIGCSTTKEPVSPTNDTTAAANKTAQVTDPIENPSDQNAIENVDLISIDLINALSQIDGMQPSTTVIEMQKPATQFGRALKLVLEQAGYGLRIIRDSDTTGLFNHAVTRLSKERNGVHNSYQIVVGDIRLKRDYFEQPYGVTPSSNMYVIGANPEQITLNDKLFELSSTQTDDLSITDPILETPDPIVETPDPEPATSEAIIALAPGAEPAGLDAAPALEAPKLIDQHEGVLTEQSTQPRLPTETPANSTISVVPDLVEDDRVAAYNPPLQDERLVEIEIPPAKSPEPLIKPRQTINQVKIKGNMYEIGKSNFAEFLKDYSDVKKDILIFGNDSLRLGRKNKRFLNHFITDFQPDSDYISVIGCSHGRSALENGNAVLATGRAQRVKEALLYSGIPEDKILEEGCWSPEHFDEKMPRRGVVITHKRERRNS